MSVGFGFSVGDFLAALDLVRTVIDALHSSGQASSAYRELVRELYTLEHSLLRVKELKFQDAQSADRIALVQAASQCQLTIDDFWKGIQKYQPYLRTGGSGSRIKDSWVKIKWAVCKVEDLAAFKAALQGHSGSIQMLLLTIQMKQTSMHGQRQESFATTLQDMSCQWLAKFAILAKATTGCLQQGKQLLQATALILRTNIQIFQAVVALQKLITQIPGQENPVNFWDARGRYTPFFLQTVDCPEGLLAMLKVRFKDIRLKKIEHGQFALTDANTKRDLDLSQPWARCFRPGQTVLMSMLFTTSVQQQNICPSCQGSNAYEQDKEVECAHCGLFYSRIASGEDAKLTSSKRTTPSSKVDGPMDGTHSPIIIHDVSIAGPEAPAEPEDEDFSAYARVKIAVKAEEISEPRHRCEFCSKSYNFKRSLRKHVVWHNFPSTYDDLRRYPCGSCNKSFFYPKDRDRHLRTHDPNAPRDHKCTIVNCEYYVVGFIRRDHLLKHLRDQHDIV